MSPRRPRSIPYYGDNIARHQFATIPESPERSRSAETFADASEEMLQSLFLSRMNIAANLRNDIALLISELAEMLLEQERQRKAQGTQ